MLLAGPLLVLISGGLIAFWFGSLSLSGLRARFRFEEARCRIVSGRVLSRGRDPEQVRPEFDFRVLARGASYPAKGYDAWESETVSRSQGEALLVRFSAGAEAPCWHDPSDPRRAVLDRELRASWLAAGVLILGSFLFGGLMTNWALRELRRRRAEGSWE